MALKFKSSEEDSQELQLTSNDGYKTHFIHTDLILKTIHLDTFFIYFYKGNVTKEGKFSIIDSFQFYSI